MKLNRARLAAIVLLALTVGLTAFGPQGDREHCGPRLQIFRPLLSVSRDTAGQALRR